MVWGRHLRLIEMVDVIAQVQTEAGEGANSSPRVSPKVGFLPMRGKDILYGMMCPPILRETCINCNARTRALAAAKQTRGIKQND